MKDGDITSSGCTDYHSFDYDSGDFECVENLLRLKICASWVEVYSMIVPFVKIPNSVIGLEVILRKLHPATPKMSTVALVLLYIAYVMMIPSRLFLIAAVMHSVPNHFYVAGYLGLSTLVWFVVNKITISIASKKIPSSKDKEEELTILRRIGDMWSLLLFSFRDVIVISLRRPNAYLISPSKVGYKTLRTWKEMMVISTYMLVEGVIGAVYVENNYPCGRNTDIFKYQGWLYLTLLIISTTLITLLSYILQVNKTNFKNFRMKSAFICGYGLIMWYMVGSLISRTRFSLMEPKWVIIVLVILMIIFLVAAILLREFSEAKLPKNGNDEEQKEQASACCPISYFKKSCSKSICCRCKTTSDELSLSTLPLSTQTHRCETETERSTLLANIQEEEISDIEAQNVEADITPAEDEHGVFQDSHV